MHKLWGLTLPVLLFAAAPSSTNYTLKTYNVGTGGGTSTSTNYGLQAGTGAPSATAQSSTTYGAQSDGRGVVNANVPPAPTFTNPSSYYDRLKLVLATGGNPSDTKYLIAVSSDNFVTTLYVQTDNSIGASQAIVNYQTYTAWGGASGFSVVGLTPSTTYKVKVKALEGKSTGSAFGPVATASTVAPSVTFSLATTLTGTPPFTVGFTSLAAGAVTNGSADGIISMTTNANNGGTVYLRDTHTGLYSTLANTTLASATADLSVASSGYGGQITSTSQSGGGPFTAQSPFNGTSNNVGAVTTSLQPLLATAGPITGGSGTLRLMAKAAALTPSAPDYGDSITLVAAMSF
ncbi:hypothetical protein IPL85_01155 [Candidatus Saccharibacteria bacterium]|nr:MAG: hypothetical protein IPL85_01155 [Candidatus Saccharibacteria bacterium]